MPDPMSFRVADMARSKAFHSAAPAPLGYALQCEKVFDGALIVGFGQAGGQNHGRPGVRPHGHAHYCGGFVIDPDGSNVEAVGHDPA